jgi:hypothetical protein
MAHTALDEAKDGKPAGHYWGGRDLLAMSLQPDWPEGDDEHVRHQRTLLRETVRRALAELVKAGAVERVGSAHRRRQAVYKVLPDLSTDRNGAPPRDLNGAPPRDPNRTEWGTATGGMGHRHGAPEEAEEQPTPRSYPGSRVRQVGNSPPSPGTPGEPPERDADDDQDPEAGQASPAGAAWASGWPPAPGLADCPTCGVMLDPGDVCGNRDCPTYGRTDP